MKKTLKLERFKLEEGDPKTVTLVTLSGEEEILASDRAWAGAGGQTTPARIEEEYIAQAIVEVDGQPVMPPFVPWKKWSGRCRDFVRAAFHRMGSASPKDLKDFLAAEFGEGELGKQP